MISVNGGTISVEGTKIDLMTELTVIMNSMLEQGIVDVDELNCAVELASCDKETLAKEARNVREAFALASILFGDIK